MQKFWSEISCTTTDFAQKFVPNVVFLKLDFDLPHIILRNLVGNFVKNRHENDVFLKLNQNFSYLINDTNESEGQKMIKNMKLTKKDADIVALKNFLPERKFNETVIKILRAAVKDRVAVVPMEFEIVPFEKHPGTKIDLPEDLVQQICEKFGGRKFTTTVKALIRQCIHQNLKEVPTKRLSAAETYALFRQALERANQNMELPDGSEKYRRMHKDSLWALRSLIEHLDKERG